MGLYFEISNQKWNICCDLVGLTTEIQEDVGGREGEREEPVHVGDQ